MSTDIKKGKVVENKKTTTTISQENKVEDESQEPDND